jgi:hypothetical protein
MKAKKVTLVKIKMSEYELALIEEALESFARNIPDTVKERDALIMMSTVRSLLNN